MGIISNSFIKDLKGKIIKNWQTFINKPRFFNLNIIMEVNVTTRLLWRRKEWKEAAGDGKRKDRWDGNGSVKGWKKKRERDWKNKNLNSNL